MSCYPVFRTFVLFSFLVVVSANVIAQKTLSGKVTGEARQALAGVTITEKGTANAAVSKDDGSFSIRLTSSSPILVLTNVGFAPREVAVGNQNEISITLTEESQQLNDVVVVGYGTRTKKELTGAISSVSGKDIQQVPVSGLDQALQGKVSGLQISSTSGAPGGNTNILIRGIGSISGGNEPLFVIDGFPVANAGVGNPLNTINPNDIESIDVLKDASATAIYGSRGSNGVIIITTRRGKAGKARLELDAYSGVQQVAKKIEMMNAAEYAQFVVDGRNNGYLDNVPNGRITDPGSLRPASYRIPAELQDPTALGEGTDWQDAIFRNAPISNYQLSASGGSENFKYALSGGYFHQQGIILNTNLKRYSFRANLDGKVSERLSVGASLAPSYITQKNLPVAEHYGSFGIIQSALSMAPNIPVYRADGSYGSLIPTPEGYTNIQNPVKIANEYKNPLAQFRMLANAYAEYSIIPSLKFRTTVGADVNYYKTQIWIPSTLSASAPVGLASASASQTENINWLTENTLTYKRSVKQHTFDLLGGFTAQKAINDGISAGAANFPDNLVENINGGTVNSGSQNIQEYTILSWLSRVNYSFNDKYLFTGTLRRDGSSRFGANNRWGTFPSASVGWRISEEPFMKSIPFVSDLKIRASYGLTGNNNIGNYRAIGQLSDANYVIGDALTPGLVRSSFSNDQLGWESMKQMDFGIDLSLLNYRVSFTADYYEKRNTDMLFVISVPGATGLTSAVVNLGKVQNRGVELAVTTRNLVGDFKWNTNFNITFNRNKVLAMSTEGEKIFGSTGGRGNTHVTQVGYPVGVFYGRRQLGIFQTAKEVTDYANAAGTILQPFAKAGDVKWKDVDGNGVINDNDREVLGSPHPDYFFGFSNTFSYRNISLDITANGMVGHQIYDATFMINNSGVQNNTKYVYDNRFISPERPGDGRYGRSIRGGRNSNTIYSSQYLFDGSYLRIRTVTLNYTLSNSLSQKILMQGLRLYATATNPFTFTKFNGYDPEVSNSGDNILASRVDFGSYPNARSFIMGVNLSF